MICFAAKLIDEDMQSVIQRLVSWNRWDHTSWFKGLGFEVSWVLNVYEASDELMML